MCGRYSFSVKLEALTAQFEGLEIGQNLSFNFNIAPTQEAYVVTDDTLGTLQKFKWGLIPFWAKDQKIGSRMINARSETILQKPAFKQAARKRHCWVLADSFYEWKNINGKKQPYRIQLRDESVIVMAGIWETWSPKGKETTIHSFSIITCTPNKEMSKVHDRMPVILQPAYQEDWLEAKNDDDIQDLLQPPKDNILIMYPISTLVNSVRNNGPELHLPQAEQGSLF